MEFWKIKFKKLEIWKITRKLEFQKIIFENWNFRKLFREWNFGKLKLKIGILEIGRAHV